MAKGFASELLNKKPKGSYAVFRKDTEEFLVSRVSRPNHYFNLWALYPEKAMIMTRAKAQLLSTLLMNFDFSVTHKSSI